MDTCFVLRFMTFVVVVVLSVTGSFSSTLSDDSTILANFTAVATVDGKTYFVDRTFTGTWYACNSFCNASGMHLATITSAQQRSVLDSASFPYSSSYWTGGRDSQTTSQFSWDFNNATLNNNFTSLYAYGQILTCVYYVTPSSSDHYLRSTSCNTALRPICEFIHGK